MVQSEGRSVKGARLYINCKPSSGTWTLPVSTHLRGMFDGNDDNELQIGGMLQLKELLKRKKQGKCLLEHMRPEETTDFFTYRITKQFPLSQGFSGLFFESCGGDHQHEELSMEFQEALNYREVTAVLFAAGLDVHIEIAGSVEAERAILEKHGVKTWNVAKSMHTDTNETKDVSLPTLLSNSASVSLPVRKTMEKKGKCQKWKERNLGKDVAVLLLLSTMQDA